MNTDKRERAYSRVETDIEFRERLVRAPAKVYTSGRPSYYSEEALDDWAWKHYGMQRKIIWVNG